MKNAIEEACGESNRRKLTVSGDGTWQKRGFSSLHGVVEIMSTCSSAKVLDLERLSKSCSMCTGALSIKHSNPTKYEEIKNKHKCEINHSGSSGEEYDHNKHSLPLGIMKAIRPVFDELAHPDTLKKVINGGSQNSNESFHAVLWSLAPKNRYTTGVVIDLCAAIAVLSYNEGDQSILPVIAELTGGGCGFYTKVAMRRLDERRVYSELKRKQAEEKTKLTKETLDSEQGDRMSLGVNDDNSLDDSYIPGAY
ncbi:unnamed protein product [Rotaria sp. Silwood2]|nr:unnamed protein product [Rotaria sp. Silwood2]